MDQTAPWYVEFVADGKRERDGVDSPDTALETIRMRRRGHVITEAVLYEGGAGEFGSGVRIDTFTERLMDR